MSAECLPKESSNWRVWPSLAVAGAVCFGASVVGGAAVYAEGIVAPSVRAVVVPDVVVVLSFWPTLAPMTARRMRTATPMPIQPSTPGRRLRFGEGDCGGPHPGCGGGVGGGPQPGCCGV